MNPENRETKESHKFIFHLSQRLHLTNSIKHVTLKKNLIPLLHV